MREAEESPHRERKVDGLSRSSNLGVEDAIRKQDRKACDSRRCCRLPAAIIDPVRRIPTLVLTAVAVAQSVRGVS